MSRVECFLRFVLWECGAVCFLAAGSGCLSGPSGAAARPTEATTPAASQASGATRPLPTASDYVLWRCTEADEHPDIDTYVPSRVEEWNLTRYDLSGAAPPVTTPARIRRKLETRWFSAWRADSLSFSDLLLLPENRALRERLPSNGLLDPGDNTGTILDVSDDGRYVWSMLGPANESEAVVTHGYTKYLVYDTVSGRPVMTKGTHVCRPNDDFSGFVNAADALGYFIEHRMNRRKPESGFDSTFWALSAQGQVRRVPGFDTAWSLAASPDRSMVLVHSFPKKGLEENAPFVEESVFTADLRRLLWRQRLVPANDEKCGVVEEMELLWSTDSRLACVTEPCDPLTLHIFDAQTGRQIGTLTLPFAYGLRRGAVAIVPKTAAFDPFDTFGLEPKEPTVAPTNR